MAIPPSVEPAPSKSTERARSTRETPKAAPSPVGLDALILLAFLGLVCLLGVFPLNDTDFWWHLRTGDLIRQSGHVPTVDPYLFGGAPNKPWIDLHWGFQVLLSAGHALGGVDLLNLAKCAIIALALALVMRVRPRAWPIEVMTIAAMPALFLLAGRMYIRPEILSLLFLSILIVIVGNWRNRAWLALLFPLVMLLWVNSHGLFVLGLVVIAFGLVDAAVQPGAWSPERRGWWRTVALGTSLGGAACFLNPHGLEGALFPLRLLGTMSNPVFESIGELEPVTQFLVRAGWQNPSMLLFLATQALGALSFVVPIVDNALHPFPGAPGQGDVAAGRSRSKARSKRASGANASGKSGGAMARASAVSPWRPSLFRLMLFLTFAVLSWKASRNSQQFAAVSLAVTAWNVGEWAAARRLRRATSAAKPLAERPRGAFLGKMAALAVLAAAGALVVSGVYYRWLGEGRTFGLGERPLWFPHAAVRAAGASGMPDRFVCIHNGHAALWIYHNGPEKKTYADARLEVIGPQLYREYRELQGRIARNRGWAEWFDRAGRPGLLLDLVQEESAPLVANVLAHPDWRCVWFDPIAAVFVHRDGPGASRAIDFADRHFAPDAGLDTASRAELLAAARAAYNVAANLAAPLIADDRSVVRGPRRDLANRLLLYAHGLARRALAIDDGSAEAWKAIGQIESLRSDVRPDTSSPRFRKPYDPVIDLETMRATAALQSSLRQNPDSFAVLFLLAGIYQSGEMSESALPLFERIGQLWAINRIQGETQKQIPGVVARLRKRLGSTTLPSWKNLSELDQQVNGLLDRGRVESAADLLENAYPVAGRPWEVSNRIATYRLHLGDPVGARRVWSEAPDPPRPALRSARVGLTYLVAEDLDLARSHFQAALAGEPALFEALYGLAILEADAGRRPAARDAARLASEAAPGPGARAALRELLATIGATENAATVESIP
jgi:tetratricopeptide (TPR) repeat protein